MVGMPSFTKWPFGPAWVQTGDINGPVLYVDTVFGSDTTKGLAPREGAYATMGAAFADLEARDAARAGSAGNALILVSGHIQEQLETPADVCGVTIRGFAGGGVRHTTASGTVVPGNGVDWVAPASPTADQPLLRLQSPGWVVENMLFVPGNGIAGIEIYSADPLEGGHAIIRGCRFVAANTTGTIGIEDIGGSGFVRVENCFFQVLASGIINTSTAQANPSWWVVTGNRFLANTTHIDMPFTTSYFTWNILDEATTNIDFSGGVGGNTVNHNSFANQGSDITPSDGYTAGTNDVWEDNYATDAVDYGVPT